MQRAYFIIPFLTLVGGCFTTVPPTVTKEAARETGGRGPDGSDLCRAHGWYDDDVCDDFCPEPDPDCATSCPDPDPTDPRVRYVSMDPDVCAVIDYACEPGETSFDNMCGCGCIAPPEVCEDLDPRARYVSRDLAECAVIDPDCGPGEEPFSDACGCGCRPVSCPDPTDPDVHYVATDPATCAAARFTCEPGQELFSDECGCGCLGSPTMCPDPTDPAVHYVARDPAHCALIDFACEPHQRPFSNECGCGCIDEAPMCPDPSDPEVRYVSHDPSDCARIDFRCEEGERLFSNECGCGCIGVSPHCSGLDEVSCSIDPECAPRYGGVCDCTCYDESIDYEPGGCDTCPSSCFFFDHCTDAPSVAAGCPNPHRSGTRYLGHDATACSAFTRFDCGDEEAFFDNSCGCGCVGAPTG